VANGVLCGCGALKELSRTVGEVKSMRTRRAFLRHGFVRAEPFGDYVATGFNVFMAKLLS
jgi:hypothetical protein